MIKLSQWPARVIRALAGVNPTVLYVAGGAFAALATGATAALYLRTPFLACADWLVHTLDRFFAWAVDAVWTGSVAGALVIIGVVVVSTAVHAAYITWRYHR